MRDFLTRYRRNPAAVVGLFLLLGVIGLALTADVAAFDPVLDGCAHLLHVLDVGVAGSIVSRMSLLWYTPWKTYAGLPVGLARSPSPGAVVSHRNACFLSGAHLKPETRPAVKAIFAMSFPCGLTSAKYVRADVRRFSKYRRISINAQKRIVPASC